MSVLTLTDLQDRLLSHHGTVVLPEPDGAAAGTELGVVALEADLLGLGYLLHADLRAVLAGLPEDQLQVTGRRMLDVLGERVGATSPHVPLFRGFPDSVPADTLSLFVDRVISWLLQEPQQPCVLCGDTDVHAVDPCGHLICGTCWDGSDYSACPICHRRINTDSPWLDGVTADPVTPLPLTQPRAGQRLTVLSLAVSVRDAAHDVFCDLVMRTSPLTPAQRDTVIMIAEQFSQEAGGWLPDRVPVRETMAEIVGRLAGENPNLISVHCRSASDVLRVACVASGGDAGLLRSSLPARPVTLARPVRRALLRALDQLSFAQAAEELLRRDALAKRVGRGLHPFEQPARYPNTTTLFALVRGVNVRDGSAGGGARLKLITWGGSVERALADRDIDTAVCLLAERPGQLIRRLDHLLRLVDSVADHVVINDALAAALPHVAAPVLLTCRAQLASRVEVHQRRLFLPKGELALSWGCDETRDPLRAGLVQTAVMAIDGELLVRSASLEKVGDAVIDLRAADMPLPIGARSASDSLTALPRGTTVPVDSADTLRLFVHWTEDDGQRVDLDLSVLMYDENYELVDLCDYTRLRSETPGAVHSGDLTSAPAPLGASEFVDFDLPTLRQAGGRHIVAAVFSYTQTAFEDMREAFAGVMNGPEHPGSTFDAAAVTQKFDLSGKGKIAVPFTVDLEQMTLRWTDVQVPSNSRRIHSVHGYHRQLGRLLADLDVMFDGRPNLLDVAYLHAAVRADRVWLRRRDGSVRRVSFGTPDTTLHGRLARLREPAAIGTDDVEMSAQEIPADAAFVVDGEPLQAGAAAQVTVAGDVLDCGHLVDLLAPR